MDDKCVCPKGVFNEGFLGSKSSKHQLYYLLPKKDSPDVEIIAYSKYIFIHLEQDLNYCQLITIENMDSIDKKTRKIIRKFNLQNKIWKSKYINEGDVTLDIKSLIIKNFSFLMEFT
jgi:hypothetical protein